MLPLVDEDLLQVALLQRPQLDVLDGVNLRDVLLGHGGVCSAKRLVATSLICSSTSFFSSVQAAVNNRPKPLRSTNYSFHKNLG